MFGELIIWLMQCANKVVGVMKQFILNPGFSYFDLLVCTAAVLLLIRLLNSIRADSEEERLWLRNKERETNYNTYQRTLKQYDDERRRQNK